MAEEEDKHDDYEDADVDDDGDDGDTHSISCIVLSITVDLAAWLLQKMWTHIRST